MEQIHTHKVPHYKSLFLHQAPSVKSTPPSHPIFQQDDAPEKCQFSNYNGNIYLHLCVLLLHVSCFSEIRFGVIHLEAWSSTDTYVAFLTFVFCSCFFVFGRKHTAPNSLTLHEPVSVVSQVKSFWLTRGWGLSSLSCSLRSRHPSHPLY